MPGAGRAWTLACQAFLCFTICWNFLRFMSIESVMLSNHLIFCCSLLLLPSILSSISVFSSESALHMRWPKYLLSPPDTSTTEHHFHIGTAASFFLELLVIAVCSPPIAYFRPGEGGGIQRRLVGYNPWGCKESDTTEHITHKAKNTCKRGWHIKIYKLHFCRHGQLLNCQ